MSSYTPQRLKELGLDGGKMLFRIDPDRNSRYSISTIYCCSKPWRSSTSWALRSFWSRCPSGKSPAVRRRDERRRPHQSRRRRHRPGRLVDEDVDQDPLRRGVPPGRPFDDAAHPDARRASDRQPAQPDPKLRAGSGRGRQRAGSYGGPQRPLPRRRRPFCRRRSGRHVDPRRCFGKEAVRHLARRARPEIDWLKESLA